MSEKCQWEHEDRYGNIRCSKPQILDDFSLNDMPICNKLCQYIETDLEWFNRSRITIGCKEISAEQYKILYGTEPNRIRRHHIHQPFAP